MPNDLTQETTVAPSGPAAARWQAGKQALAKGDMPAAREALLAALEFHPSAAPLLLDLVLASRDDADLVAIWSERFVRAASDASGKLKLDAATRKATAAVPGLDAALKTAADLAAQRAAAITELARFVDKQKPTGKQNAARALLVRWAGELLLEAGRGAPAAVAAVAAPVAKTTAAFVPDHDTVFTALSRVMARTLPPANATAPTTGPAVDAAAIDDRRVRAARILVGLRRQGAFKDLQGPAAPDLGKFADDAQQLLDAQREQALAAGKVWSIDELAAMTPEQAAQFTQSHRDWHRPGIAMSTTGRYRIETICGHSTLLGVARTVEQHHARLVDHFGSDPFLQRLGVVRIVPESSDLETEGAPYWWAGGFQGGDRTTLRFAWGDLPGLGRGLTHELTHRFDGVLRPFLPSWYGEGHASWTGGHYAHTKDPKFVDDYLQTGTPAHTYYKGYADRRKFEELLTGKVEDYRDNYFAGYSLYAFLRSFPPGQPRYRTALATFEKNARAGQKDPLGFFTATFCDGKEGRPATFDELFTQWQSFVRGCYEWLDDKKQGNEWVARYGQLGKPEHGALVMDEPTWSWARTRAEPFFGQDHAAAALLLLHEVGDHDGAIAAGVWSLTVDGWRPDTATALLASLRATKAPDAAAAAAAVVALARARFPQLEVPGDGTALLAALPKTKALLDALATRTTALAAVPAKAAAATTLDDHFRLARLFSLPRLAGEDHAPPPLPRHLAAHGLDETDLIDFHDRRVKGLWYTTPEGDLHVGREKPRDATGTLDRYAHQRDAFVHGVEWQAPGDYVLRGRVHFTTSFVSGAIVFGHTRRDRDLRLGFSSGDFDYATGRSEQNGASGRVGFWLRGRWERDQQLPDTGPNQGVELHAGQSWFDYEIRVQGPRATVLINGEPLLRYAEHDGTPIEGQVGFAMGMGAIRVQCPTVQRLDSASSSFVGLDLATPTTAPLDQLMQLPTRGVPRGPNGTIVLLLPKLADAPADEGLIGALMQAAKLLRTPLEFPQSWVLAVPRGTPADVVAAATRAIQELRDGPLPVVEHAQGKPFDGREPWFLFVDAQGVLRATALTGDPDLHTKVQAWARKFRDRQ